MSSFSKFRPMRMMKHPGHGLKQASPSSLPPSIQQTTTTTRTAPIAPPATTTTTATNLKIVSSRHVADRLEWNPNGHLLNLCLKPTIGPSLSTTCPSLTGGNIHKEEKDPKNDGIRQQTPPRRRRPQQPYHLELAVGCHPERYHGTRHNTIRLPNIPIVYKHHHHHHHNDKNSSITNRSVLADETRDALHGILQQYYDTVCGWVVEWPLTSLHGGICGAQCGKVLHTLEAIAQTIPMVHPALMMTVCLHPVVEGTIILPTTTTTTTTTMHSNNSNNKKQRMQYDPPEDEWGRSPVYGLPPAPDKKIHIASLEQYNRPYYNKNPCVVRDVWRTYALQHWPNAPQMGLYDDDNNNNEEDEEDNNASTTTFKMSQQTYHHHDPSSSCLGLIDIDNNNNNNKPGINTTTTTTKPIQPSTVSSSSTIPNQQTVNIPKTPWFQSSSVSVLRTTLPPPLRRVQSQHSSHHRHSSRNKIWSNLLHFVP